MSDIPDWARDSSEGDVADPAGTKLILQQDEEKSSSDPARAWDGDQSSRGPAWLHAAEERQVEKSQKLAHSHSPMFPAGFTPAEDTIVPVDEPSAPAPPPRLCDGAGSCRALTLAVVMMLIVAGSALRTAAALLQPCPFATTEEPAWLSQWWRTVAMVLSADRGDDRIQRVRERAAPACALSRTDSDALRRPGFPHHFDDRYFRGEFKTGELSIVHRPSPGAPHPPLPPPPHPPPPPDRTRGMTRTQAMSSHVHCDDDQWRPLPLWAVPLIDALLVALWFTTFRLICGLKAARGSEAAPATAASPAAAAPAAAEPATVPQGAPGDGLTARERLANARKNAQDYRGPLVRGGSKASARI